MDNDDLRASYWFVIRGHESETRTFSSDSAAIVHAQLIHATVDVYRLAGDGRQRLVYFQWYAL